MVFFFLHTFLKYLFIIISIFSQINIAFASRLQKNVPIFLSDLDLSYVKGQYFISGKRSLIIKRLELILCF